MKFNVWIIHHGVIMLAHNAYQQLSFYVENFLFFLFVQSCIPTWLNALLGTGNYFLSVPTGLYGEYRVGIYRFYG